MIEKLSRNNRIITHLLVNIFAVLSIYFFENSFKNYVNLSFALFGITFYYSIYFGTYLLERIAIKENHKKSHFYLISKLISVLLNLSFGFCLAYYLIYLNNNDSIILDDKISIGNTFFEKISNFYYFSLGNFLGFDKQIIPNSILFKLFVVFQYLYIFIFFIYLFSNFEEIKKSIF